LSAGPWNVLDDSYDIAHAGPSIARRMENIIPLDGGSSISRPGLTKQGAVAPGTIQAQGQLTTATGTEITYRITNGTIQTYTWATSTWAAVVTAANFVTATITISTTALCYCINFNGKLLAHDGINVPWTWDGTAGAAGLTKTTQAAVWYGMPWVKDARVFAIQNATRNTFEYSNINNAITGYATAAFTWAFGQVDETPLTAGIAVNDAMIIFRARSCQAVYGKVTATWSTDGSRAGLSETVGTSSPFGVCERNGEVWFIDSDGRPQVVSARQGPSGTLISVGPDAAPIWHRLRETLKSVDLTKLSSFVSAYFAPLDLILLGVQLTNATASCGLWFIIDPLRKEPVATWTGFEFTVPGLVKNASLQPLLMLSANADKFSYTYADVTNGPWDDALNSGTVAVTQTIEATPMSAERNTEVEWDSLTVVIRPQTTQSLGVYARTPNGSRVAQTITTTGSSALWDVAQWDVDLWSSSSPEVKRTIGLGQSGRWIAPVITHTGLAEQFGLVGVTVAGVASTDNPRVR